MSIAGSGRMIGLTIRFRNTRIRRLIGIDIYRSRRSGDYERGQATHPDLFFFRDRSNQ